MGRRPAALAALALSLAVGACSPGLPKGVARDRLDEEISRAIGDPNTCLLIARAKGGVVYRYNSHTACARPLPSCEGAKTRKVQDLLDATLADGRERAMSCNSAADGSRGVGWASGPIAGQELVYAAAMEGDRAFPGRMMAERLKRAFKDAGL